MITSINLLPPNKKTALKTKFFSRLFLWQWFWVWVMTLFYLIIIGSIYAIVSLQDQNLSDGLSDLKSQDQKELQQYRSEFKEANEEIKKVAQYYDGRTSFVTLLSVFSAQKPNGIRIEKFSTKDYRVKVLGVARERSQLLAFQKNLETQGCFQDVVMPLSNLFSESNVTFEIDFTIKETCLRSDYAR